MNAVKRKIIRNFAVLNVLCVHVCVTWPDNPGVHDAADAQPWRNALAWPSHGEKTSDEIKTNNF